MYTQCDKEPTHGPWLSQRQAAFLPGQEPVKAAAELAVSLEPFIIQHHLP